MWAAAEGRSKLGIPKSVGEEFVGKDAAGPNGHAAGIVFVAPDGDVLLLRRASTEKNYGGHFGLPGGKGNEGESPEQTARREALEEMGAGVPEGKLRPMNRRQTPNGMVFHTFAQPVKDKFVPALDGEHSGYAWASLDMLPRPLHPSVAEDLGPHIGASDEMTPGEWRDLRETFAKWTREEEEEDRHSFDALPPEIADLVLERVAAGATPKLAMDWAGKVLALSSAAVRSGVAFDRDSVRYYDKDGRLHVKVANISKAAVNPYLGREINAVMADEPGWKMLEPDRVYKLLRHPDELRKAAATFNNLPLLSTHEAVSAADHKPELVVGSLGTDASYEHPFLRNSLVVWAKHGIDGVESDEQKELSASYRYRADMTPGEYEGEPYDGVMRDIVGNHVAQVKKGRAGSDVVVGDSSIEEISAMAKTKLTRTGMFAAGALAAMIYPKLAKDAALDLSPILSKLQSGKPLKEQRAAIADAVKAVKLAKDASIEDVATMLDNLEKVGGVDELDPSAAPMMAIGEEEDDDEAMDAGAGAQIAEYLKGCIGRPLTEEDVAKVAAMAGGAAQDEEDDEAKKKADEEAKKAEDEKDDKEEKVDKKAMDEAIKLAVEGAEKSAALKAVKLANDIAAAKDDVEPYVGKISKVAFDSADAVYKKALEMLEVPTKDLHPSAYKPVLHAQPKAPKRQRTAMAADEALAGKGFAERFPQATRIGAS